MKLCILTACFAFTAAIGLEYSFFASYSHYHEMKSIQLWPDDGESMAFGRCFFLDSALYLYCNKTEKKDT